VLFQSQRTLIILQSQGGQHWCSTGELWKNAVVATTSILQRVSNDVDLRKPNIIKNYN